MKTFCVFSVNIAKLIIKPTFYIRGITYDFACRQQIAIKVKQLVLAHM